MKKTKILVLTIALSLGCVKAAYASLPDKTLIVGSKAYNLSDNNSINNNISDIRREIYNNPSVIYYKDTGRILDIFTGTDIGDESSIVSQVGNKITYYDSNGTPQIYAFGNGEFNPTESNTESFANITVETKKITGGFFIGTVRITKLIGISGEGYFKVGNSFNTKLNNTVTIPYTSDGSQLDIYIYPNDQSSTSPIASGKIIMPKVDSTDKGKADYTISLTPNSGGNINQYYVGQGNITNGGYVTGDKGFIYYSNTADSGKIYKTSVDGLQNTIICDDNAKYLSLYGDWIYYSNYSDNSKLYKIRTDGTGKRKVSDNVASYINVKNDKVYYCNGSDRNKIYVVDLTGKSQPLTSDEASYLTLANGYLYYSNLTDSGKLYKISLDGTNKLKESGIDSPVKFINSVPNLSQVYFATSDGRLYHGLDNIPVRYITKNKDGVVTSTGDDKVSNINVVGSTAYYKSLSDGGKLYKVDASSGGVGEKLTESSVDFINVFSPDASDNNKDVVYYVKAGKLYLVLPPTITVDKNGVQTKKLNSAPVAKLKLTDKITKLDNITKYADTDDIGKNISQIDVYKYLPDKVSAIFSDSTVRQVVINWDTDKVTFKNGVYTFSGTVVGYGNKITLSLVMASDFGISPNDINIINVVGVNNDSVTVAAGKGLSAGDILKVYDPDTNKVIGSGTAADDGSVSIDKLNLKSNGGTLLFTVTKKGQAESRQVSKSYGKEMPKAPTGIGIDLSKVTDDADIMNNKDGFTIKPTDLFGNTIGDNDIDDLEFIVGKYDPKKSSVVNWDSTWVSCDSISAIQIPKSGMQIKVRYKAVTSTHTPESVATNPIIIQPRASAPLGLEFNEKGGSITNAASIMEYTKWSLNSDNTGKAFIWQAGEGATIQNVTYPIDQPVRVRYVATKNSLPSLETLQIKINSIKNDGTLDSVYAISEDQGSLTLKSPVPVTWSVTETNGNSTTKVVVQKTDVLKDTSGNIIGYTAKVQGLENGVARVNATDSAGQKGYVDILMSNQSQITVANDVEFNNALPRKDIKTIVLKPYIYNLDAFELKTLGKDLTIKGQGNNCQINMASLSAGNFISTNGQKLTLQSLVIDGNGNDVERAINADSTTVLKAVTFRNIKHSDSSKPSIGVNFAANGGDLTVDGCSFDGTNTANAAIVVDSAAIGNVNIIDNTFAAMQRASKQQVAYIQNSDNVKTSIKGNTIKDYANFNTNDIAIKLNKGIDTTIGGVDRGQWNTITGCAKGIVYKPVVNLQSDLVTTQNFISGIRNSDGKVYNIYEDNAFGVSLGQLVRTTKGVAATTGTAQKVEIKVSGSCTASDTGQGLKVTVAGVDVSINTGDTADIVAGQIAAALNNQTWTATASGNTVTLVAGVPAENIAISPNSNNTGIDFAVSNIVNGAAPTDAVQEADTLTIASGADALGYISIRISDGTNYSDFGISVGDDGSTPDKVAAKIVQAINSQGLALDTINYTAIQGSGNDSNKVIIKQVAPGGKDVNLKISLQ